MNNLTNRDEEGEGGHIYRHINSRPKDNTCHLQLTWDSGDNLSACTCVSLCAWRGDVRSRFACLYIKNAGANVKADIDIDSPPNMSTLVTRCYFLLPHDSNDGPFKYCSPSQSGPSIPSY